MCNDRLNAPALSLLPPDVHFLSSVAGARAEEVTGLALLERTGDPAGEAAAGEAIRAPHAIPDVSGAFPQAVGGWDGVEQDEAEQAQTSLAPWAYVASAA